MVFFTDGAGPCPEDPERVPKIGAVVAPRWRAAPAAIGKVVPEHPIKKWIPRKNQIAMIELLAVVMVIVHHGPELAGKRVMGLIDSEPVLDALIKGQSKHEDVIYLLRIFWDLIAEYQIAIYLDRVSTDSNPSDGMSRDGEDEAEELGWEIESQNVRFPQILEHGKRISRA